MKRYTYLILGVALSGALTIATAVAMSVAYFPLTYESIRIDHGARDFAHRCATCHAIRADEPLRSGPSLHEIGRLAATRVPGMSAENYIFQSIVDPDAFRTPGTAEEMPQSVAHGMKSADLINLTAFLVAHGRTVDYRALLDLAHADRPEKDDTLRTIDLATVERGRELYCGKLQCAQCHALDTTPDSTLVAPSLLRSGLRDREFLLQSVIDPSAVVATAYTSHTVMRNGLTYTGRLLFSDDSRVRLLCPDGTQSFRVYEFDRTELDPLEDEQTLIKTAVSAMPSYKGQLTEDETRCLLDFLGTLH